MNITMAALGSRGLSGLPKLLQSCSLGLFALLLPLLFLLFLLLLFLLFLLLLLLLLLPKCFLGGERYFLLKWGVLKAINVGL